MLKIINFIILIACLSMQVLGEIYSLEELAANGVFPKDGMYYCPSLGLYMRPNDDYKDVLKCAFATKAYEICSSNPHTRWISGRCFCPQEKEYLLSNGSRVNPITIDDRKAEKLLNTLAEEVKHCSAFIPRDRPFGRSVILTPNRSEFIVVNRPGHEWDNRDDLPGEQGNPHYPTKITTLLGIKLGFYYNADKNPILPNFNTLVEHGQKIDKDISFFEVDGELSGREYLEAFVKGRIPMAKIEADGDATFFLHDLNFHAVSFLLLPPMIRELAQRQTHYLLEFIEFFSKICGEKCNKPQFKLALHYLIKDQVQRIDSATGNLMVHLFNRFANASSFDEVKRTLENLSSRDKVVFNEELMDITYNRLCMSQSLSVLEFLNLNKYAAFEAFTSKERADKEFLESTLSTYIRLKQKNNDFTDKIKIASRKEISLYGKAEEYPSSIDLFLERIESLRKLSQI